MPDGDFRTLNNVNLDTCKSSCAAISRCVGFTFDTHNNSCVMKERLRVAVPGNGKLSGVKRRGATQSQATRTIPNILNNTDLPNYGNPAADYQITFMPSIDACKTRCEADQRCQAFTYNLSRRACILKNSYERRDRVGGAFSGIKE